MYLYIYIYLHIFVYIYRVESDCFTGPVCLPSDRGLAPGDDHQQALQHCGGPRDPTALRPGKYAYLNS